MAKLIIVEVPTWAGLPADEARDRQRDVESLFEITAGLAKTLLPGATVRVGEVFTSL